MKKSVCAGIVTYNPNIDKLRNNILCIKQQVDNVFICDNGSNNIEEVLQMFEEFENIQSILLEKNEGIAVALNFICRAAKEKKYEAILTLDQDSQCSPDLVDSLSKFLNGKIAIVAPHIVYNNNEKFCRVDGTNVREMEWVITSASLTNLSIWEELGGFQESLFIDRVDYDYCIRARRAGYKILQLNTTSISHELGNMKCYDLFHKVIHVTNHTPKRYYYMVRNSVYLYEKYRDENIYVYILKLIMKILIFEHKKMIKLVYICSGIKDGILWNLGYKCGGV